MTNEEERAILTREFPVEFSEDGDGRTLETRIVPYNSRATVSDPPDYEQYQEMFVPGAFERQTSAANRVEVYLNFEHEPGLRGIVGHGVTLEDREDALYGTFRLHENTDGEKARELVKEGILTGISVEFAPIKSERTEGVVKRLRAHLDKVSLCRPGLSAYKEAEVLAVRMEPVQIVTAINPDLSERLERVGYMPLPRAEVVRKPWNDSADRFEDEEWKASCVLDRGEQFDGRRRYALPVLEPNGDLNVNALRTAASKLNQTQSGSKADAARKLVRYFRQANEDPPAFVLSAASR